jgi:hypothetical protein
MKTENGMISSNLEVSEDYKFLGLINGSVTVHEEKLFELHGMITNDLSIERNARAIIFGSVNGNIYNNGGTIQLVGTTNQIINK